MNVMLVFCKYSTPVQIIFKMRRDVTLISACDQAINCYYTPGVSRSFTHCCHRRNYSPCTKPYPLLPKQSSSAWRNIRQNVEHLIFCISQCPSFTTIPWWMRSAAILLFLSICLPFDSSQTHRTLRSLSVWLTGWAHICIAHWWQLSLILLAVPNYHHFFMQPGSQDSASLQGISPSSSLSNSL